MKKQRFFVISKMGSYDTLNPLIWFESLEHAMTMFKILTEGKTIELGAKDIKKVRKKKNEFRDYDTFRFMKRDSVYHLESKFVDVYTEEELNKTKKARESQLKDIAKAKKARKRKKVK